MFKLTFEWEDGTKSEFVDLKLNKALSMIRSANQFKRVVKLTIEDKQPELPKK